MKLFLILPLLVLFLVIQPFTAMAEAVYGLAMTGIPKYNQNSLHLDYANPNAPKGGTLRQAASGSFDTLNPYTIKGKAPMGMDQVSDRLMVRVWDEPFTLYPLIAARVEVPEDRSALTVFLDPRARFHDSSPILASDVIFSFETLKKYGRPNMRRVYALVDRVDRLDDRTVKFNLGAGHDRETVMILAMMPVLSKAYWADKVFDQETLQPFLSNGPYKIAKVDPGRKIIYERVKDYWAADKMTARGHFNFDTLIYEYFRDDTAAFESFKTGDLNFRREGDAGQWLSGYNFPAVQNNKVIRKAIPHGRPDRVRAFIFNIRKPLFADQRVRTALSLVFDFEWVNKTLFGGTYRRIDSFFPNTSLSAPERPAQPINATPEQKRQNITKADLLLKQAGWTLKDGQRINEKTGAPFSFEIMLDDPAHEKIALSFVRSLKRLGINARVRVLDSAAFLGRLNNYDFDMTLYHWMSTLSPGTEQYLYWSCEAAKTPSRWNYAGICDKNIDAYAKAIPLAKTREDLEKSVQALDRALLEGVYMIPLFYNPHDFVAYWSPVTPPPKAPLYGTVLETWWMEKGGTLKP